MTHSTLKSLGVAALALALAMPATAIPSACFPQQNEWTIAGQGNQRLAKARHAKSRLKSTVTDSDTKLGPTDYFGTLTGPSGESWYYTADYTLTDPSNPWSFYAGVSLKIYDSNGEVIATIDDTFELADNELGVNSVQLNPNVTQKFFNYDDKYEVMIFIHATTNDYSGHCYNHVFTMEKGATTPLMTIEGNQVQIANVATDSYTESYYMLFERDGYDQNYNYWLQYDVYSKATYYSGGKPQLVKTLDIDYDLVADSGNGAYPILMNAAGGKHYFAMPHCEKPYFDPDIPYDQEPVVNEDNTFIIDLYDQDFELVKTTRIPMATKEGYLYSIPTMGLFRGQDDLDLGFFSTDGNPLYVITYEHYINSSDSFCDDIVVVDQDGNTVKTVFNEATGRKLLNDVRGYNKMYCFYNENSDAYHFVEVPSCKEVCSIPFSLEYYTLSTSIDRVASKDGYQILSALTQGQVDEQENVIQKMAFFNPDGAFDHWEDLNLGPDVVMATVNISGAALSPYIFNTNDTREYMVIVKIPISETSSATEDHIWIIDTEGYTLLDFGPDDAKGGKLLYVALAGSGVDRKLFTVYYDTSYQYTLNLTNLPLEKFTAGGEGTKANPYVISTVGDFMLIDAAPAAHYALGANIDFTGMEWNGLSNDFTGSLDGCGKVISGVNLDGASGIFASVMGASSLKDFIVNEPTVVPSGSEAGIVAERLSTDGTSQPVIYNVSVVNPKVSGSFSGSFGGIVGQLVGGASVELSQVLNGSINLPNATVGGILGANPNNGGNISACLLKDTYIYAKNIGGIAGQLNSGTVADCHVYADWATDGTATVGGIAALVNEFMGARPTITRCVTEGEATMTCDNFETLYGGGIAGQVEEGTDDVITSCISNLIIGQPATMYTSYIHRIAGYTSGDMPGEINWEDPYWNDNPDYSNPSEWPRYPSNPEEGIKDCYAIGQLYGDAETTATASSVDGKSIELSDITSDFLAGLGYQKGESVTAPWRHFSGLPFLFFEDALLALVAQEDVVYLSIDETATLAFLVIGNAAIYSDIYAKSSDTDVVEMADFTFDGPMINVDVIAKGEGTAQVTTYVHGITAVTTVHVTLSGVKPVVAETKVKMIYNGAEVIASEGPVSIYNLAGVEVTRSATGTVSVASLPSGVYIARSGSSTLKFMR